MQTFLPLADFAASAACLDNRRLGNQRNECRVILAALAGATAWARHPVVQSWRGHAHALVAYHNAVVEEWVRRGYRNSHTPLPVAPRYALPPWLGDEAFHAAHRRALLAKDPQWYGRFGWKD